MPIKILSKYFSTQFFLVMSFERILLRQAAQCSFVLARLHGNSVLVKNKTQLKLEVVSLTSSARGKEQKELTELRVSEWSRGAGWFTAQRVKDVKTE